MNLTKDDNEKFLTDSGKVVVCEIFQVISPRQIWMSNFS